MSTNAPVAENMIRLRAASALFRENPERPFAYLISYAMHNRLQLEASHVHQKYPPRFMGHNIYVGATVPGTGILFLPEPTIRSMVGIWHSHREYVEYMMKHPGASYDDFKADYMKGEHSTEGGSIG